MIFYFSGSGNSEYVARRIAAKDGETIVSIGECMRNGQFSFNVSADEKVGFVIPVYYWGLPTSVSDFIRNLTLVGYDKQYTWTVVTCGGDIAALPKRMCKALEERDMHLDYLRAVFMVDTYITLLDLLTPENEIKRVEANSEPMIDSVINELSVNKRGISGDYVKKFPYLMTAVGQTIYKLFNRTKPFRVNDACIGCGLCAKMCPCSMIEMTGERPIWKTGHCSQCHSCLNRCPVRAIDWGRKTQNRGRYVNPNI